MDPFKEYDIRGIYPYELNEDFAYNLGKAVVHFLGAKKLVVGRDGRKSSDSLFKSLVEGITSMGCNVINVGRCSTPQFYFDIFSGTSDGGIMITASHNPKDFNGFKVCGKNAKSIYLKNGLLDVKKHMDDEFFDVKVKGNIINKNYFDDYVNFFSKLKKKVGKKMKIIFDTGNGMGISEVKALKKIFGDEVEETVLFPIIDGEFPNHECNPTKSENVVKLVDKMKKTDFDLGFAFDGDCDRVVCFLPNGEKIPSDVLNYIIAKNICVKGDKVGVDVRANQAVISNLKKNGFRVFIYPSGHSIINDMMIKDGCVFAGEKSGHSFYQKLHYTDSSLFSIMNVIEFCSKFDIIEVVSKIKKERFSMEEINYNVVNKDRAINLVEKEFNDCKLEKIDGLSVTSKEFYFNIRKSNTEDLLRLNIDGVSEKVVRNTIKKIERIISRA
jgi:phosphomannomutase